MILAFGDGWGLTAAAGAATAYAVLALALAVHAIGRRLFPQLDAHSAGWAARLP